VKLQTLQNISPKHFHKKVELTNIFTQGKLKIIKHKDEILQKIGDSLHALLPWQQPL